jgi:hypothetical protein
MSEYIIRVDENDERWHYVEQQYTHFFGYPITEEIVRCRDCRFSLAHGNGCGRNWDIYDVEPDGFCKWGERRDDGQAK